MALPSLKIVNLKNLILFSITIILPLLFKFIIQILSLTTTTQLLSITYKNYFIKTQKELDLTQTINQHFPLLCQLHPLFYSKTSTSASTSATAGLKTRISERMIFKCSSILLSINYVRSLLLPFTHQRLLLYHFPYNISFTISLFTLLRN